MEDLLQSPSPLSSSDMETEKTYPKEFVIVISILFAGEIIVGTMLNVYVTIKWIKDRSGKNSDGNNFITTLKVIDLFICVCVIPLTLAALLTERHHNTVVCFLKEGLVVFASSGSSVGVLLISVDRYCAVVLPTNKVLTPKKIRACLVCVVLVGIIGFILPAFGLFMGHFNRGVSLSQPVLPCRHVIWLFQENYVYEVYFIVLFVVAVFFVFLCYRSVLRVVRRRLTTRTMKLTSTSTGTAQTDAKTYKFRRQEYKATRIAFAVVLSFLICWGPHVFVTMCQLAFPSSVVIDIIQFVTLVIAYLTTIIHPVIYTHETVERSTTNLSKVSAFPFLKGFCNCNRRSVKVTPEHIRPDTSMEQSCSCAHVTIQQSTVTSVSNTKINVSEYTV